MRNALFAMTTAAFGLAGLSACSPVPKQPAAGARNRPGSRAGYSSNLQPYRIQVGDVLAVRLMLNPELNEEVTVGPTVIFRPPSQRTNSPLVAPCPGRLPALPHATIRQILHNPRLTVVVKSFAPTRIYVGGK